MLPRKHAEQLAIETLHGGFLLGPMASKTLRIMLVLIFSVHVVKFFYNLKTYGFTAMSVVYLLTCSVLVSAYFLVHVGRVRQAMVLLVSALVCAIFVTCFFVAGVRTPALAYLPGVCMLTAWLINLRTAGVVFGIFAIEISGFVLAEHWGYATPNVARTSLSVALNIIPAMAGSLAITYGAIRSFKNQLIRVMELTQDQTRQLEERVAQRTAELTHTIEDLNSTRDQLVQAEKMASLGAMVAGVSHELNTPIGITLTAASNFQSQASDVAQRVARGEFRRSDMTDFLEALQETSALIVRSAERAADLISSFKQVAVDRTSQRQREFAAGDLVNDIVASLKPSLGHRAITIEVQAAQTVVCNSLPGAVGQVLTNLIQNAILHAFDAQDSGHIQISLQAQGERVVIEVMDNGKGMDEPTLRHAFDPFFTTKLGKGGSGLGLSVSYNIATAVLGGNLSAKSTLTKGTTMHFEFLRNLPEGR